MITSFAPFRFSTLFMHPLFSVKLMTSFSLIVAKYMSMLVCVCMIMYAYAAGMHVCMPLCVCVCLIKALKQDEMKMGQETGRCILVTALTYCAQGPEFSPALFPCKMGSKYLKTY